MKLVPLYRPGPHLSLEIAVQLPDWGPPHKVLSSQIHIMNSHTQNKLL